MSDRKDGGSAGVGGNQFSHQLDRQQDCRARKMPPIVSAFVQEQAPLAGRLGVGEWQKSNVLQLTAMGWSNRERSVCRIEATIRSSCKNHFADLAVKKESK